MFGSTLRLLRSSCLLLFRLLNSVSLQDEKVQTFVTHHQSTEDTPSLGFKPTFMLLAEKPKSVETFSLFQIFAFVLKYVVFFFFLNHFEVRQRITLTLLVSTS